MMDKGKGSPKTMSGSRPAHKAFNKKGKSPTSQSVVDPIRRSPREESVKIFTKAGLAAYNKAFAARHQLLDKDAHRKYGQWGDDHFGFSHGQVRRYKRGQEPRSRGTVPKPEPPPPDAGADQHRSVLGGVPAARA